MISNQLFEKYTAVHSFISFRPERFGGYIYNPFIDQHIALDTFDVDVLGDMDGTKTLNEISTRNSELFLEKGIEEADAKRLVFDRIEKLVHRLNSVYAIKFSTDSRFEAPPVRSCGLEQSSKNGSALSAPLSVLWDITTNCNLQCRHCLNNSGRVSPNELSENEIYAIIDQLADMGVFSITICGGEPLMHPQIFSILNYATQKKLGLKISSNGLLIDESVLDHLENTNVFSFQISLDGCPETHDNLRGRTGAFARTSDNISRLVDAGYHVTVAPVITQQTINDMDFVLETAMKLNAAAFRPSICLPIGRGKLNQNDLSLSPDILKQYVTRLMEQKEQFSDKIFIQTENLYPGIIESDLPHFGCQSDNHVGCSAGTSQVVITSSGKIVPCSFLYDFVAGDLREKPLQEIWTSSDILTTFRTMKQNLLEGKCKECGYVPERCAGGCRAAAYLASGNLFAEDPICWVNCDSGSNRQG